MLQNAKAALSGNNMMRTFLCSCYMHQRSNMSSGELQVRPSCLLQCIRKHFIEPGVEIESNLHLLEKIPLVLLDTKVKLKDNGEI